MPVKEKKWKIQNVVNADVQFQSKIIDAMEFYG